MLPHIFERFILPILLGAAVGFERSATDLSRSRKKTESAHNVGVRTFSFIAVLGVIAGTLYPIHTLLSLTVAGASLTLVVCYYIIHAVINRDTGITTELALLLTFATGVVLNTEILPPALVIAQTVIIILLLSRKAAIERFILGLSSREMNAFISYALIALVVLPFLPNHYITLSDIPILITLLTSYGVDITRFATMEIINPYRLWFIVALVTGIDMTGHFIERIWAKGKGQLLAGFLGGFISSTATTQALAQESITSSKTTSLVAAAVLANGASFIQLLLLLAGTNSAFLVHTTPFILLLLLSSGMLAYLWTRQEIQPKHQSAPMIKNDAEIISIAPALKFSLLFVTVRIISKLSLILFGDTGFLAASALAALTGIDAAVLNIAEMAGKTIDFRTALIAVILVNAVNLGAKSVYGFAQGSRTFAGQFAKSAFIITLFSLLSLLR